MKYFRPVINVAGAGGKEIFEQSGQKDLYTLARPLFSRNVVGNSTPERWRTENTTEEGSDSKSGQQVFERQADTVQLSYRSPASLGEIVKQGTRRSESVSEVNRLQCPSSATQNKEGRQGARTKGPANSQPEISATPAAKPRAMVGIIAMGLLKCKAPPVFSGKIGEDAADWKKSFEVLREYNTWTDVDKRTNFGKGLEEPARQWFQC